MLLRKIPEPLRRETSLFRGPLNLLIQNHIRSISDVDHPWVTHASPIGSNTRGEPPDTRMTSHNGG